MRSFAKKFLFAPRVLGLAFGMGLYYYHSKALSSIFQMQSSPTKDEPEPLPFERENILIEEYKHEKVEEIIAKGEENLILVINPNKYKESFKKEILDTLEEVQTIQSQLKYEPIRVFRVDLKDDEEMRLFSKKTGVSVATSESIFVLHNTYSKKFLNFSFNDFFSKKEAICKYFRKISTDTAKLYQNFDNFLSDQVILIGFLDKNDPKYEELKASFFSFAFSKKLLANKNLNFIQIEDESMAKDLGIEEKNTISILLKDSKSNMTPPNLKIKGIPVLAGKVASLSHEKKDYIKEITEWIEKNKVSSVPSFSKMDAKILLNIKVNKNSVSKSQLNQLYRVLAEAKQRLIEEKPQLAKETRIELSFAKGPSLNITALNINANIAKAVFYDSKNKEEIKKYHKMFPDLENLTYEYQFGSRQVDFKAEDLIGFLERVANGTEEHWFKSQEAPAYQIHSREIVGSEFHKKVLESPLDQVVFVHDKHCGACNYLGPFYEEIALDHLKSKDNIDFNRMDSSNHPKGLPDFVLTPVFMMLKKEAKHSPLIFKMQDLYPMNLKNFIEVSHQVSFVEERIAMNLKNQWALHEDTVKWIKEVSLI